MNKSPKLGPTEHEVKLYEALKKRGIDSELQYPDGHKTVDIAILSAKIYIEVDDLGHYTDPQRIISDFARSHYSDCENFCTFRVTNQIIDNFLDQVADAIAVVVMKRTKS